ncbi:GntR family transcriptional regulator [Nocardioides sp.]|uniref:GntR family transcriptional regulator n=1 Tax=Nocardioides sp. TaxID=35761 RepID=UPI00260B9CC5|nr:GntR family transcriptional regulator [Nocardioides sp.]
MTETTRLELTVDRASDVPLYQQVADQMVDAIESGRLEAGTRLEGELQLAQQSGLSRPTMRRAIELLVDQGLLVRRRGSGTQVVHGQVRRELELTSLYEDLSDSGQTPGTRVLVNRVETIEGELADELGVAAGKALRLERLRLSGGAPLAILVNWLPVDLIQPSDAELETHGLYQLLRDAGARPQVARQVIGARAATEAEARLLECAAGDPLLTMRRTAYDDSGRVVEVGHHCYRPEGYSFEVTLVQR